MTDQLQPDRQNEDGLSADQQFENMVLAAIHATLPSATIKALTITIPDDGIAVVEIERVPISTILFAKEILDRATPQQSRDAAEGAVVAWRFRYQDGGCTAWFDGKPPNFHGSYEVAYSAPPQPAPDAVRYAAEFLLARLQEYDPGDSDSERDFHGHVAPAIARLHNCLSSAPVPPAEKRLAAILSLPVQPGVGEREALCDFLEMRAAGFQARAASIFSGAILADELRETARTLRSQPPHSSNEREE